MQTLKTAVVVVLLLAGLYGAYVVLNRPEAPPPPELAWQSEDTPLEPPMVDFGPSAGSSSAEPFTSTERAIPSFPLPTAPGSSSVPPAQPVASEPPLGNMISAPSAADTPLPNADAQLPFNNTMPNSIYAQGGSTPDDRSAGQSQNPLNIQRNPFVGSGSADTVPAAVAGSERAASPATEAARQLGSIAFQKAWKTAQQQLQDQQWQEALFTLSIFHRSPDLLQQQQEQLVDLLDPLAGKVIYSNLHLLEPAYEVGRGERLSQVAERYNVPWQLLQKINGIENPDVLVPGTQLKVVPGPFRAEVELSTGELTLYLGRLYAGRFPITVGNDPAPEPGEYTVRDKQPGKAYYAADGRTATPGQPQNPYGTRWIDLGSEMSIHGSPNEPLAQPGSLGCISLSPIDAEDVYDILSLGSKVLIRR